MKKVWISIKISLMFVPISNYIPILVQIIAWHRPGDRSFIICTTDCWLTDAYMLHSASVSQITLGWEGWGGRGCPGCVCICIITAITLHQRSNLHYSYVIMSAMASQITGVSIVYLIVCSCADQRKHQSSASGLCEGNSPMTGETRKMFPFWWRNYALHRHGISNHDYDYARQTDHWGISNNCLDSAL